MAVHTVSVCQGRGSLAHNNRIFITPNVDKSRTYLNIVYIQEPLAEAYNRIFGEELARFNATQKRADRKILDYMEHIRKSKNGEKLFYETVVQIGNKHTCNALTQNGELAAKILDEYMKDFQKRNPNLYLFNAVLHMDEQTPHIHIDYIPVARGYQKGLQIRNSLDKALKQQGIDGKGSKKDNSTQRWQKSEKKALGEVMERYGWQRAAESGIKREKMTVSQYKATMSEIEQHASTLPDQIERKPAPLIKGKVVVSAEELDALELRAKLSIVHEEAQQAVQEKMDDKVAQVDDYVNQKLSQLQMQQAEVERKRRIVEEMNIKAIRETNDARVERAKYTRLYNEQHHLNDTVKSMERENASLKAENASLKAEILELKEKMVEILNKAEREVRLLATKWEAALERAYNTVCAVCKAIGMLKYDKEQGYLISSLTTKQGRLIDAVANYGANAARDEGYTKIAEDIDSHIGISQAINKEIMRLKPKDRDER